MIPDPVTAIWGTTPSITSRCCRAAKEPPCARPPGDGLGCMLFMACGACRRRADAAASGQPGRPWSNTWHGKIQGRHHAASMAVPAVSVEISWKHGVSMGVNYTVRHPSNHASSNQ